MHVANPKLEIGPWQAFLWIRERGLFKDASHDGWPFKMFKITLAKIP